MLYSRSILSEIKPFLGKDLIILLVGSRQVGKTSLLQLIKEEVKNMNLANDKTIFFFDLESLESLTLIQEKNPEQFVDYLYTTAAVNRTTSLYVFIDEIQYLKNPSSFFKLLADHHPTIHLILSGSSSLEIKKIFTDRLTGRKVLFEILPLSFSEYLFFQEFPHTHLLENINAANFLSGDEKVFYSSEKLRDFLSKILPLYEEFVIFGAYPRPSLLSNKSLRRKLLEEIRDVYVRKDISDILRVENVVGFNRVLHLLAAQSAQLFNVQELSNSSDLSRETVERFLFFMQETFILSLLTPYFQNVRQEIIKMPKIYFSDTGIRNFLLNNLEPLGQRVDTGHLVENAVFHQLALTNFPLHFWRTKTKVEVDFVVISDGGKPVPCEVKYQTFKKLTVPSGLNSFIERYHPPRAFVITRDTWGKIERSGTPIFFVPAFCW